MKYTILGVLFLFLSYCAVCQKKIKAPYKCPFKNGVVEVYNINSEHKYVDPSDGLTFVSVKKNDSVYALIEGSIISIKEIGNGVLSYVLRGNGFVIVYSTLSHNKPKDLLYKRIKKGDFLFIAGSDDKSNSEVGVIISDNNGILNLKEHYEFLGINPSIK